MEVDQEDAPESMSDTSSEGSDEGNVELTAKAEELELKVISNPQDYDAHVQLITTLRTLIDLDKLRVARNRMSQHFPLAPNLWVDWLQDEVKIATSSEEKKLVQDLFERAVKDYLSVEVWLEYVQFSIGLQAEGDENGFENVRGVFERALTAAGLHVVKGALLWEAYIEFEVLVLSLMQAKSQNLPDEIPSQMKRIANLFRRQLSCPLQDMDDTFETFNMWLVDNVGSLDSDIIDRSMVENTFKKTRDKLAKIDKFESDLLKDINNHSSYIEHEKSKEGSPPRVLCLYERIIVELCLTPSIWLEYIEYIETVLQDTTLAIDVARRSLRNIPWSGELAQVYLRLLERSGAAHEEMNEAVEKCFLANKQGSLHGTFVRDVWLSYLEYMRRRFDTPDDIPKEEIDKRLKEMRVAFEKALEHLSEVVDGDPEYTVAQFYSRVEFKSGKDVEKARQLWTDILADPQNRPASLWLEYINLEMAFGDTKHLRKLFIRALQQTTDWPESIFNAWLNFERDEGTLESYMICLTKGVAKIKEVQKKRQDLEQKMAKEESSKRNHQGDDRRSRKPGLGFQKSEKERRPEPLARKRPFEQKTSSGASPEKKTRREETSTEGTDEIVSKLLNKNTKDDHPAPVKHDHSKDNRTVFVSNLDYSTQDEAIREIFAADGTITDLRMVKDFKNRSKGYCYVEFEKVEMAQQALKRDRQLVGGRPMYVSKCDPDSETRGKAFRYATGLEKNKLFVKGLPFTTTEAEVREMFGKYGILKDVRLVTFRNGHFKGLAYVDYEDEVSAAQAVLKADGSTVGDKQISVAISNPPGRQTAQAPLVASLGGGPKDVGPRGKGRSQLFVPRSLQLAPTKGIQKMSVNSPQPPQ